MNALMRRSLVAAIVSLAVTMAAESNASDETVRLLNMFAKSEADLFEVHIVADGDISGFKTTRRKGPDSYRLTIDVPALSPVDTKYDVQTPFTRSFEMWPMKLGDVVYSRIILELDLEASSVVSQERPTRILIKISRSSPAAYAGTAGGKGGVVEPSSVAPPAPGPVGDVNEASEATEGAPGPKVEVGAVPAPADGTQATPPQPPSAPENPSDATAPVQSPDPPVAEIGDDPEAQGEFISLFPAPNDERPLFEPPIELMDEAGAGTGTGILLGRFLFRPMAELSWIHGDNLTLQTDEKFADNAIYARGIAAFELLQSDNTLNFAYQLRYRDFDKFQLLKESLSHGVDVGTGIHVSPRMTFTANNHFFRGSFETPEFDPGQEVFFNVEPFNRNQTEAGLVTELNERLGVSVRGIYDFVRFQEDQTVFFNYDTVSTAASFHYRRSPLSSIFGEYVRAITPEPAARPEAQSTANAVLAGLQGEITALLRGTVRVGYSWQDFGEGDQRLEYRGLVASASLTRYFTEATALTIEGGRQTNLSNYQDNNYYLSHFASLQYTGPLRRNLQLVTGASLFDNLYPLESIELPERRNDHALAGWVGAAYFFTPLTYFRADYRYERRRSNLDQFQYSNNVLRFIVGVGFFSR